MKEYIRICQFEGTEISIKYILGENAQDNHDIITNADNNDWWFHLDDLPSAHCIVEKDNIDNDDKIFACQLIYDKSKHARRKKKSNYCFTQIKNIRKTRTPGEVTFLKKPEIFEY